MELAIGESCRCNQLQAEVVEAEIQPKVSEIRARDCGFNTLELPPVW